MKGITKKLLLLLFVFTTLSLYSLQARVIKIDDYYYYQEAVFSEIKGGKEFAAGLTDDGRLYTWGLNDKGQLGTGDYLSTGTPTDITPSLQLNTGETVTMFDVGVFHTVLVTSENRFFGFGWNQAGEIGDNTRTMSNVPVEGTSNFNLNAGENIIDVAAGSSVTIVLTDQGRIFTFGLGVNGALGTNTTSSVFDVTDHTAHFVLQASEQLVDVELKYGHALAFSNQNRLYGWGSNSSGQLFLGTNDAILSATDITPVFNLGTDTISTFDAGNNVSLVTTTQGKVYTAGINAYGQLGDGTNINRNTPTDITANFSFNVGEYISAADVSSHAMLISNQGRVFGFGYNNVSQLMGGLTATVYDVTDLSSHFEIIPSKIHTGSLATYAQKPDGSYYVWGDNDEGGLGTTEIGDFYDKQFPFGLPVNFDQLQVKEYLANGFVKVESNEFTLAITSTGDLYGFGDNGYGQLGTNDTSDKLSPTLLNGFYNLSQGETVIDIGVGDRHSIVLTSNNRVLTSGYNAFGQLGNNTTINSLVPIDITSQFSLDPTDFIKEVYAGYNFNLVVSNEGKIFTFGENFYGQLSTGDNVNKTIPTDVTSSFGFAVGEVPALVSLGYAHGLLLTNQDNLYSFGANYGGQLGDNTTNSSTTPININTHLGFDPSINKITYIGTGINFSGLLNDNNEIYMWGDNLNGYLGNGNGDGVTLPTLINPYFSLNVGEVIDSLSIGHIHTFAKTSDHRSFSWGLGINYALGTTFEVTRYFPEDVTANMAVGTETIVSYVLGYQATTIITDVGNLYGFGDNSNGLLGIAHTTDQKTPQKITKDYTELNDIRFIDIMENSYIDSTNLLLDLYFEYDIFEAVDGVTVNGVYYDSTSLLGDTGKITVLIPNTFSLDEVVVLTLDSIRINGNDIAPAGPNQVSTTIFEDTEPPVIEPLLDQTIEVHSSDIDWTELVIVSDNSNGPIVLTEEDNILYDTLGTYQVSVYATDESNNQSSITFNVTVVDTVKPVITYLGNLEYEVNSPSVDFTSLVSVQDNYDGDITNNVTVLSGVDFTEVGTYQLRYNIQDSSNNFSQLILDINIVDTTAPYMDLIENQTIEVNSPAVNWAIIVSGLGDNSGLTPTIIVTDNVDYSEVGTYTVRITIEDDYGNSYFEDVTVHVVDTTDPTFDIQSIVVIEVNSTTDVDFTSYVTNASDNSTEGILNILVTSNNVNYTVVGTYQVEVSVSDYFGNVATGDIEVQIVDTTMPDVEYQDDLFFDVSNYSDIDWLEYIISVTDNSLTEVTNIVVHNDTVDFNTIGNYEVEIHATDDYGNTRIVYILVTINDTSNPFLSVTQDVYVEVNQEILPDWLSYVTEVSDNDPASNLIPFITDSSVDITKVGMYMVEVSVSDDSGNTIQEYITVHVQDSIAPTFTNITDKIIEVNTEDIDWTTYVTNLRDNSNSTITLIEIDNIDYTKEAVYQVTVTATDESLNSFSDTFNVTVVYIDRTPPVITYEGSLELQLNQGEVLILESISCEDEYSDTCIPSINSNVDNLVPGFYQVIVTATDDASNESSITIQVEVLVNKLPEAILNPGIDTIHLLEDHVDAGVSFTDETITVVDVANTVDNTVKGTYTITYTYEDLFGNSATAVRYVSVVTDTQGYEFVLGEALTTIEVGDEFTMPTCSFEYDGNSYICNIINLLDTDVQGMYSITFKAVVNQKIYTKTIYVYVHQEGTDLVLYYRKEEEVIV